MFIVGAWRSEHVSLRHQARHHGRFQLSRSCQEGKKSGLRGNLAVSDK
jgi:hypothetical protein